MPKTKTVTTTTSKKTSTRKPKDPNAPKRYRTSYILFSLERREQVKTENPGLSAKEIVAELGAQWKAADAATKQRFQKLSDAEKSEYEEKMAAYKSENGDKESAAKENQKKKKATKENEVVDLGNDDSIED